MQNIITQVSEDNRTGGSLLQNNNLDQENIDYYDGMENDPYGNSLIHLNIQENHYFITRDQLMSLPESLLLCLFPSGVFLDREGQVISNLTPDDEVYITNFPPDCFEYIMEIFTRAHDDLINNPVEKLFERNSSTNLVNSAKGFFGFGNNHVSNEHNILHQKPAIIVLREDLDYYCVPQQEFKFSLLVKQDGTSVDAETENENNNDLLHHFMAQVKIAAGSYLANKTSIFQGLFSSNRLRYQNSNVSNYNDKLNNFSSKRLGPAEQHLMDMLCSSGFDIQSRWGNRTQEAGKTVISSLSLCRLANESTEEFRNIYYEAETKWENEHNSQPSSSLSHQISNSNSENNLTTSESAVSLNSLNNSKTPNKSGGIKSSATTPDLSGVSSNSQRKDRKKSRLSALADNVRSRSTSRNSSQVIVGSSPSGNSKHGHELPKVYDLVPKPDINEKLLLFWRKPARKCWWGDEEIELDVEIYGNWADDQHKTIKFRLPSMNNTESELNKIRVPVRLHIRRVWTLELSVIGVQ